MKFNVVNRCREDLSSMHGLLKSFLPFARKRMGFNKPPTIHFQSDEGNASKLLGKTAHYDPTTMNITVYVTGRHPKDVLRSLSHELVHHGQNCRGEFSKLPDTAPGYAQNDSHLRGMEEEAYKVGNLCFRDWEDGVKSGSIPVQVKLREAKEILNEVEEPTLTPGMGTEDSPHYGVARLQAMLHLTRDFPKSNINGIYDEATEEAIKKIQGEYNLTQTGSVDKATTTVLAVNANKLKQAERLASRMVKTTITNASGIVFPIDKSDMPNKISPFGMRPPIESLARKHAPTGPQPNAKLYARYSKPHPHNGIDLAVPIGTRLYAPVSGKITSASSNSSSGIFIVLSGEDGRSYSFAHLNKFFVSAGDVVSAGEVIGETGNSGPSTGAHLHFGVKQGGRRIDPMSLYQGNSSANLSENYLSLFTDERDKRLSESLLKRFKIGAIK